MKKTQKKDFLIKFDKKLNEFADNCKLVKKVESLKFIKDVLKSKIVNDIDKKLKPNFDTIMKVFGILGIISGVFGLLSFGAILTSGYFFGPFFIRFSLISIVILIASVLSTIGGYGMFNLKKRTPTIVIANFAFGIISLLLFSVISTSYVSGSASNIVSFVISAFLMLLILKNKDKFID